MNTSTRIFLVGLAVIAFTVGLWSYGKAEGDTISICVRKSGLVYIVGSTFRREDCRRNESLLTWNIQGPQGGQGEQGIQGIQGEKGDKGDQGESGNDGSNAQVLHWVDNNGQDLGIYYNSSETYIPSMNAFVTWAEDSGQNAFPYSARVSGVVAPIWFDGPNCTGQAFMRDIRFPYQRIYTMNSLNVLGETRYFMQRKFDTPRSRRSASVWLGDPTPYKVEVNDVTSYALDRVYLPFSEPVALPIEVRPLP